MTLSSSRAGQPRGDYRPALMGLAGLPETGAPLLLIDLVARAAKRARRNQALLAWAFARYEHSHHLTTVGLAAWLGLPPAQLAPLALCRRPESQLAGFGAEVNQLAALTGCDGLRLATLLREVDAECASRGCPPSEA
jgi:hypothetical protein